MEWPPDDLLGYLNGRRELIAADRKLYGQFRAYLWPREPEFWELVSEMLKARARYYRGEMVKARQDVQRYALGEDPQPPRRFNELVCGWVDSYLDDLQKDLDSFEVNLEAAKNAKTDFEAEWTTVMLEGNEISLSNAKQSILDLTKQLERITYG